MQDIHSVIDDLVRQHDEHMKHAYKLFLEGEEVAELWAYGAGLQHAIRTIQDLFIA